jgi:protein transport protein SEC31
MKLKEVNRKAVVAWSPSTAHPDYIAMGTVAGALDASFSSSAVLEIFPLNLAQKDTHLKPFSTAPSPQHFEKLSWGVKGTRNPMCPFVSVAIQQFFFSSLRFLGIETGEHPSGLIAGGMEDGGIYIWNPDAIISGDVDNAVICSLDRHTGAVRGLEFNPNQSNVLASASADGEVFVWDLTTVNEPSVYTPFPKQRAGMDELTCVTWNRSKQAPHILACAGQGKTLVWDLKQRRAIRELCNPAAPTARVSCLAWSYENPFQLVVASDDDKSPALQLWDLRQPVSPLLALNGHHRGVHSVSWCPHDAGLLLSCGKDSRTLCWDPLQGELLCELPSSTNWNFDVQWSPRMPAVYAAASFNGGVAVHSLLDVGAAGGSVSAAIRAPSWLRRPASVSFGFGGAMLSLSQPTPQQAQALAQEQRPVARRVVLQRMAPEPELAARAADLREALQGTRSLTELCAAKAAAAGIDSVDAEAWAVLSHLLNRCVCCWWGAGCCRADAQGVQRAPRCAVAVPGLQPGRHARRGRPPAGRGSRAGSSSRRRIAPADAARPRCGPRRARRRRCRACGRQQPRRARGQADRCASAGGVLSGPGADAECSEPHRGGGPRALRQLGRRRDRPVLRGAGCPAGAVHHAVAAPRRRGGRGRGCGGRGIRARRHRRGAAHMRQGAGGECGD